MTTGALPRRITLCADDYGLSPGVNRAIRDLIERGRLNATSVMTVAPAFTRDEIEALLAVAPQGGRCAIGLHVTLTAPFHPQTLYFKPLAGNAFLSLNRLLRASLLRRLDVEMMRAEIAAQIAAFTTAFGRPPDYLDGHQHAHLFPQIRDAFVAAACSGAPQAWVRQCGRVGSWPFRVGDHKALLLDRLSAGFRRRAARANLAFNPAFAGAYDFARQPDFAPLVEQFLRGLPDGGLIMCHPGFVDDTLIALDPLTDQRAREHAFLASDDFPRLLDKTHVTLG